MLKEYIYLLYGVTI